MSINKVFLSGFLGSAPEYRVTKKGTPMCTLRLATHRDYTDQDGERVTDWHKLVYFGKHAEHYADVLDTGTKIFVQGANRVREGERDDGTYFRDVNVLVEKLQYVPDASDDPFADEFLGDDFI
jgi:single-strand DNA-binding protein